MCTTNVISGGVIILNSRISSEFYHQPNDLPLREKKKLTYKHFYLFAIFLPFTLLGCLFLSSVGIFPSEFSATV